MLAEERHQRIMQLLSSLQIVKLQDLVQSLDASESTVRRDLQDLESKHLLRRIHGGASLLKQRSEEPDMDEKTLKNVRQKKVIASLAAKHVQANECIYLDAGTTTLELIPFLKDINVTVVTNGISHIEELVHHHIKAYLIGGMMKQTTKAFVGGVAMQILNQFRFDKAFIGTNGIDPEMGYTTPDLEEALIKRRAEELSAQAYVLADSSKFSEISFCKMFDLEQAAIITDELPESASRSVLNRTRVISPDRADTVEYI